MNASQNCAFTAVVTCDHKPDLKSFTNAMTWVSPKSSVVCSCRQTVLIWFVCNLSCRVHCQAGCAQKNYIVYGTDKYRAVSEDVRNSEVLRLLFSFFNERLFFRPGFEYLCCSHSCRGYPKWTRWLLHFTEKWWTTQLHRFHKTWHHHLAVSSRLLSSKAGVCFFFLWSWIHINFFCAQVQPKLSCVVYIYQQWVGFLQWA